MNFLVASALWAVASAFGVALVGLLSLGGGRARPRGAYAFGLFCVLWGLQIAAANLPALVPDADAVRVLALTSSALLLVLPYLLIEFAIAQVPRHRAWNVVRAASIVTAGLGAALLTFAPGLLFEGVQARETDFAPVYGPLHLYLVQAPFFLALIAAILALHAAHRSSATPRVARRTAILIAGMGLYAGKVGGGFLVMYAAWGIAYGAPLSANDPFWVAVFLALAAATGYVVFHHARIARSSPSDEERKTSAILAGLLGGALVLGAIEAVLVVRGTPGLNTVGLWRLAGVGIITYGIARWRIWDLPRRTTSVAAGTAGAAAAAATGAAAYGAGAFASSSTLVPAAAGLVVLAAAIVPSMRMARRLFGLDGPVARPDLESALYGQRIDAYRAALEASLARGTLEEDAEFLAALRERFTISDAEERVLMHYARSSVIVARDRHAFDAYERLRLLGEGGAGRSWLARDRARDRLVVLKEPLPHWQQEPSAREAVLREARTAAKVRHPNVVAVEEVVEGKASPVIVMEYMEGGSLSDLLRARGTLPWSDARALMLDVLRGVEAVHAAGIVHRDLKPSNILLSGEGVAKVADFGIAVATRGNAQRTIVMDLGAASSTIAGTLAYMPPEARAGEAPDRRADVYACAAILHECLYGAPPSLRSPVVVRNDLPPALPALLARALSDRPEERPATARALGEELARL